MIEIISITKPISLKKMEIARKNQHFLLFTGVNRLKEKVEVKVLISEFKVLEQGSEYFSFKGKKFESNKIAEGITGVIKDNSGCYGRLILHI